MESGDRPVVELFVKAARDRMKNGPCPTCHRYFLVFYILRERGLVDLVVTTFWPDQPPDEVKAISTTKRYPLVKVHKGVDASGRSVEGVDCELPDEIDLLVDRFECEELASRKENVNEGIAEDAMVDLYKNFNIYLKQGKDVDRPGPLLKCLARIDAHLKENETTFMVSDRLQLADCYLLPYLQHIRIAGKWYKDFDIPVELTYLWRYLRAAYSSSAFTESCPADTEIINHYRDKLPYSRSISLPRPAQEKQETHTLEIPTEAEEAILQELNGDQDDLEEQEAEEAAQAYPATSADDGLPDPPEQYNGDVSPPVTDEPEPAAPVNGLEYTVTVTTDSGVDQSDPEVEERIAELSRRAQEMLHGMSETDQGEQQVTLTEHGVTVEASATLPQSAAP